MHICTVCLLCFINGMVSAAMGFMVRPISMYRTGWRHCAVAAIKHGQSIDTSMGFTPLEGLLMGTRSGDLDPAVVLHIMNKEELSMHEANTMLNKHSGIQGLSGLSSDMREIEEEYDGNNRARLAHQILRSISVPMLRRWAGSMPSYSQEALAKIPAWSDRMS